MADPQRAPTRWIDALWLCFLGGLALLPPVFELHKQLAILAIAAFQLLENRLLAAVPQRGHAYSVIFKILLATLLLDHTGDTAINSTYYPIYFLPVVSAAMQYGPLATLGWTALASLAYLSLLFPALQEYELTSGGEAILMIRVLFFFIAAMLVNRFAMENRRQVERLEVLSSKLEQTNRQLRRAEVEARRAERLAALGQLSAGLAHEIRNPLAVIKGSSEMLGRKLQDTQPLTAELAGFISSEVNRLNALVARFLDFARPSEMELRPARLSEIVDHAIEPVRAQFPEASVRIERQYAPDVPEVPVDRQLAEQVFVNLITNAFQAMSANPAQSEAVLRLSIMPAVSEPVPGSTPGGESGVRVTVEDSGPGVPAEVREQIFNPFFTSKKDGVGLGLSIVAKIMDDHHGSIRLDRDFAGGARFRVFFPLGAGPL